MRWRQILNPETGKSELVPIDEAALKSDNGGVAIHGVFDSFVSIVDGSIISTAKQLREHNIRNNVVNAAEFTPEFYEKAAKKRADFYQGNNTREETFKRRQAIYDSWIAAERKAGH